MPLYYQHDPPSHSIYFVSVSVRAADARSPPDRWSGRRLQIKGFIAAWIPTTHNHSSSIWLQLNDGSSLDWLRGEKKNIYVYFNRYARAADSLYASRSAFHSVSLFTSLLFQFVIPTIYFFFFLLPFLLLGAYGIDEFDGIDTGLSAFVVSHLYTSMW